MLARAPEDINLGSVLRTTEADFALVECFASGSRCVITKRCSLPGIVNEALNAFIGTFDRYTLADIALSKRDFMSGGAATAKARGPRLAASRSPR